MSAPRKARGLARRHRLAAKLAGLFLTVLSTPLSRRLFPGIDWMACDLDLIHRTADAWAQVLTASERSHLAMTAVLACDEHERLAIAERVMAWHAPAGWPLAVSSRDLPDHVEFWAERASDRELRLYAMACLARLPEAEREALVRALRGRAAA